MVDASLERPIALLAAMRTRAAASEPDVTVRVFTNGGSQAVTIPREFRLSTKRASVRRHGDALISTPAEDVDSWDDLRGKLQPLDESFPRWPTGPAEKRSAL
jgi:virulence-associated protein VagC